MSRRKLPGRWVTLRDGTKRWELSYYRPDTGKQTRKRFTTKADAEQFYDELQYAKRTDSWISPDASRQLFSAFVDEWASTRSWSPGTSRTWPYMRKRIVAAVGEHKRLGEIDPMTLGVARRRLLDQYAKKTASTTFSQLVTIMRAAYDNRRVAGDVTRGVERIPYGRTTVTSVDVPTELEAQAMIDTAPLEWAAGVSLLFDGLRIGEMLGAHVEQYDRNDGRLVVDRQAQYDTPTIDDDGNTIGGWQIEPPKCGKTRSIYLSDRTRSLLDAHLDRLDDENVLIFPSRTGTPVRAHTFRDLVWIRTLDAVGIERRFTPHKARHFAGSLLIARGASLTDVAAHLGDTVAEIENTYAHLLRGNERRAADLLSQPLGRRLHVIDGGLDDEQDDLDEHDGPDAERSAGGGS